MTKFIQKYSVICSDIDLKSQMTQIATPIYFQDCYIRYAAKNNFATFDLEPKNMYWFIADYNIFLEEDLPYWSENFYVETWISKISKLKIYVDFVYKYKDKVFAKGQSTWLLFDKINKKPLTTDVLFKDYSEIEKSLFEIPQKINWANVAEPIRTIEHVANMTDLDFNGHVNNRSYVNIAITTASKEIQEKCYIKQLAVKFLQQAYLGDKLTCTSFATDTQGQFITSIQTNSEDICKIYTAWDKKTNSKTILDCNLAVRNAEIL